MEHFFTTFVRTKTVFKHRLNDLKDYSAVRVYAYELKKLGMDSGPLLYALKEKGEIWYDNDGNFRALHKGPVDPSLLDVVKKRKRVKVPLSVLHEWMREHLLFVEILDPNHEDVSVYFKAFLEHRHDRLDMFFNVDAFAGRVHTPVVNLKGDLRSSIRFYGGPVVSLDVKQMQPAILAKVLLTSVGDNPFSSAIFDKGEDVYVLLQRSAKLTTRSDAKKMLFQLIFGKPMSDIGKAFDGDTKWVDWINSYKSRTEEKNPHKEDKHTNLAWLLQYSEVQVMTDIWQALMDDGIPFLTIHDDILCRVVDADAVYKVMDRELKKHFSRFEIVITK